MPANIISINNVSEFYVGDSKMPDLIAFLADKGFPQNKEAKELIKAEGFYSKGVLWVGDGEEIKRVEI